MKILESLKGEGWKHELKNVGTWALAGLLFAGGVCLVLFSMQRPLPGQKAATCVLCSCFMGSAGLVFGLLMFIPVSVKVLFHREFPSLSDVLIPIGYYVAFLLVLVYVPRWNNIVGNVRDGYHDFQRIHQGEPREHHYRIAETCAETTRPIWEWLSKMKSEK